ncbi:MAG TPA: alpha/beta hydrolase [Candidatus Cybelea sp.]
MQMKRGAFLQAAWAPLLAPAAVRAADPSAAQTARGTRQTDAFSANDVRAVIAAKQKIVAARGIEELQALDVNGCTQWLSIRGRDRRNPVLLYLHGGPGSPTMPEAWTFAQPWEDYFTVVQWDQRGAGKTYASNDPQAIAPTMTAQRMIADAQYIVAYLLERLNKRKLFALGHSWGSFLGMELARRNPGQLHAYVGTGQMIDTQRSEAEGYEFALAQARAQRNAKAVRELEALAPYPGPLGTLTVDRIGAQRTWVIYYGGLTYRRRSFDYDADCWKFSPEYADRDVRLIDKGSLFSLTHLLGVVERTNFEAVGELKCPLFIFQGKHDYETSWSVVHRWFARVRAPHKRFVTFLESAHMGMLEQPGEYLRELVNLVRPIALERGDGAPPGVALS